MTLMDTFFIAFFYITFVEEYVNDNFIEKGFCAIAAIHEGKNEMQPEKNNPHVHIIVPTRSIGCFIRQKNVIVKNI